MLAVLPVAVLAGSPQRVALSALIAAAYVGVALVTVREAGRGRAVNRILIAYVALAAAWMVLAWLRSRFLLHLQPEQLDYASSKAAYFVLVVLPMAAAVAMMVDRAEAIWPTALSQVAIGGAVAVLTVALLGDRILGEERYSWQGNLIALGTVLAIQPWPIQKFKASVVIGVLGVAGIMLADSRQSVVATIVAMFASAVYWTASRYIAERGTRWSRLRFAISGRYVVLPLVLILLTCAYIGVTYAGAVGAHLSLPGVSVNAQPSSCHCVTDRIVSIQGNAGDRDHAGQRDVAVHRELEELAGMYESTMLAALVAHAEGAVRLADGDAQAALGALRRAGETWLALEAPYEIARTRVLVGEACRLLGDGEAADLEHEAARSIFERLGAKPDLARFEAPATATAHGLSRRELEVLRLVASGKSNREIAAALVISEHTVARHVQNIFGKLRLSSRAAATAFAFEHDLV